VTTVAGCWWLVVGGWLLVGVMDGMRRAAIFLNLGNQTKSGGASGVVLCLAVIFLFIFAEGGKAGRRERALVRA
jgi:hypothetical protein